MYNNLEGFESLNEKEKELVLKILNEYSSKGSSKIYNKLLLEDYKEVPVDIITFIKDRQYLGNAWHTSSGKFKLYPYWEEKLKELFPDPFTTKYNNFIESGARGIGKAQPLDSTVFTEFGYRKMEEISVGDKVFGEDGILHEVVGVFPQGIKNICEVSFSDGTTTLCCEDHLWTVNDIYFNTKNTYSCKQLMEKGLLLDNNNPRYKIPIVEPITFENVDLSIDPFFMGLLLGHGNFYSTTLDELTIKKTFKFVGLTNITDDMIEDIKLKLVSLNLFKVVYSELFIPKDYLYNSIDNRIKLLLGMLASINYSFENLDDDRIISTSSKLLYEDVAFIIQSLGGLVKKRVFTHVVEETVYFLDPLFPDIVYKKVGIDKKNKIERFITSIDYKEQQECKCIYLNSKNHLYLTNDLIVTHNSEIAVILGLYLMHRLMCLKNPHEYLNLKPTEKVVFAFMNITMTLAEDIGVSKLQESVKISPWFMERGYLTGRDVKIWNPPDFIEILIGSQSSHLIGRPLYFSFLDEISFIKNQEIDKQKKIAMDMMDTAIAGMKTRFINKGKNPTLMVLASSKRTEKSFLEEHMRKKLEEEDETVLIIDEPIWNIKPKETYSGKKFYVAQGNRFLPSEIIPDNDELKPWKDKGYTILEIPIEFKTDFKDNIDRALCDYAGVSSSELTKYISGARLAAIRSKDYKNAFVKEIIEVGNAIDDKVQYSDFFDMSRIEKKYMSKPLFVHIDTSLSGDKTGIAGVWILGKKHSSNTDSSSQELYFKLAFSTSVKAPKGHQISFAKNREFIYWLKEKGFALKGNSTDTYQTAEFGQDLISKGYPYEIISVDRVDKNRVCLPYAYLKNCIYEQRLIIYDNELLTEETLALERSENTGKIDHPFGGSKDQIDAVCGALFNASKHADEYAFYYGEDIDNIVKVSSTDLEFDKKQLEIDMQEELNKMFKTNVNSSKSTLFLNNTENLDEYLYLNQGIIV